MFLTGAASTGTAVPARTSKAAADTNEFFRLLQIIIRSCCTVLVRSCSTSRNGDPNLDVAPNSIGIRADVVGRLGQVFGRLLVDSGDSDQLHIKQPVLAADLAMTAASCGNFGG